LGVVLEAFSDRSMPLFDRLGRPLRGLVGMTTVAGVGRAKLHGQIRPWYSEAVIVPFVDHHLGAYWYVARCAGDFRRCVAVVAMRGHLIFVGGVALQADAVARRAEAGR